MASSIYNEKKVGYYESTFKVGGGKPQDVNITITAEHIYGLGFLMVRKGTIEGEPEYTRFTCSLDEITKVYVNAVKKNMSLYVHCDTYEKGVMYCRRIIIPCLKNASDAAEDIENAKEQYLEKMQKSKERAKALEAARHKAEEEEAAKLAAEKKNSEEPVTDAVEETAAPADVSAEDIGTAVDEAPVYEEYETSAADTADETPAEEETYEYSEVTDENEYDNSEDDTEQQAEEQPGHIHNNEKVSLADLLHLNDVMDSDGTAPIYHKPHENAEDELSDVSAPETEEFYDESSAAEYSADAENNYEENETVDHEKTEDNTDTPELAVLEEISAAPAGTKADENIEEVSVPELGDIEESWSARSTAISAEVEEEIAAPELGDIKEESSVPSTAQLREAVAAPEIESIGGVEEEDISSEPEPESVSEISVPLSDNADEVSHDDSEAAVESDKTLVDKSDSDKAVTENVPAASDDNKEKSLEVSKDMSLEDFQNAVLKLKSMLDAEVISRDEFDAEKKKLLSSLY